MSEDLNICETCLTSWPHDPGAPRQEYCRSCLDKQWCDPCDMLAHSCHCWISLEGMPLADIKGYLALAEMSLIHDAKEKL